MLRWRCVRWSHIRVRVVDVVCTKCVSEWAVGACGAVGVVCGGGRRSCGIWVGELLMMLLHQIFNDSSSIAATARPWWLGEVSLDRGRGAPVVDLSKLNMREQVGESQMREQWR